MKKNGEVSATEFVLGLVIVALVIGLAVVVSNHNAGANSEPTSCFVFSDGWELVGVDSWGNIGRQGFVYTCRNTETKQYAECAPVPVDCK